MTIRVAVLNDQPIASVLTLQHRKTMVYKYGCSDERFHSTGAMPRLFWDAIEEAVTSGFEELDLGRSDETNPGLVRFKDHLGAARTTLRYWQSPPRTAGGGLAEALKSPLVRQTLTRLPDPLFRLAGQAPYRDHYALRSTLTAEPDFHVPGRWVSLCLD